MKHFAYNKQSGYKGHLETTASLSFPPKNVTLIQGKMDCSQKAGVPLDIEENLFPLSCLIFLTEVDFQELVLRIQQSHLHTKVKNSGIFTV